MLYLRKRNVHHDMGYEAKKDIQKATGAGRDFTISLAHNEWKGCILLIFLLATTCHLLAFLDRGERIGTVHIMREAMVCKLQSSK